MIEINGSYGEGGGAILRQALGLAAYAGQPVRVTAVRAKRDRPGLRPQHLRAVEAVAAICGARVEGAALGSTMLEFRPGPVRAGSFTFDVGTAGAATLVLQALLLPCLGHAGEFDLVVVGGTDVPWSPPADYLAQVTLPALRPFGEGRLTVLRRGYYPKGGGRIQARLRGGGGRLPVIEALTPARVTAVHGISHAARTLMRRRVAERQAAAVREELAPLAVPVAIEPVYHETYSPGSGVTLWTEAPGAIRLGGSALGARNKSAEQVGREAARLLRDEMAAGAAVDRHLADQLVPFLAVGGGSVVTSAVTSHVQSNIYVAEAVLGTRLEVRGTRLTARPAGVEPPARGKTYGTRRLN